MYLDFQKTRLVFKCKPTKFHFKIPSTAQNNSTSSLSYYSLFIIITMFI